jgi:hypothetical protein
MAKSLCDVVAGAAKSFLTLARANSGPHLKHAERWHRGDVIGPVDLVLADEKPEPSHVPGHRRNRAQVSPGNTHLGARSSGVPTRGPHIFRRQPRCSSPAERTPPGVAPCNTTATAVLRRVGLIELYPCNTEAVAMQGPGSSRTSFERRRGATTSPTVRSPAVVGDNNVKN